MVAGYYVVAEKPYVGELEEMLMVPVVSNVADTDVETVQVVHSAVPVMEPRRAVVTCLPLPHLNLLHHSSLDSLLVPCAHVAVRTALTLVVSSQRF